MLAGKRFAAIECAAHIFQPRFAIQSGLRRCIANFQQPMRGVRQTHFCRHPFREERRLIETTLCETPVRERQGNDTIRQFSMARRDVMSNPGQQGLREESCQRKVLVEFEGLNQPVQRKPVLKSCQRFVERRRIRQAGAAKLARRRRYRASWTGRSRNVWQIMPAIPAKAGGRADSAELTILRKESAETGGVGKGKDGEASCSLR